MDRRYYYDFNGVAHRCKSRSCSGPRYRAHRSVRWLILRYSCGSADCDIIVVMVEPARCHSERDTLVPRYQRYTRAPPENRVHFRSTSRSTESYRPNYQSACASTVDSFQSLDIVFSRVKRHFSVSIVRRMEKEKDRGRCRLHVVRSSNRRNWSVKYGFYHNHWAGQILIKISVRWNYRYRERKGVAGVSRRWCMDRLVSCRANIMPSLATPCSIEG